MYPQKPEELRDVFPPPISEVVTPMCVVFVGSSKPSPEWLREKAYPLIIRRQKVRLALEWLKNHNPLYRDIIIDYKRIEELPLRDVAPVNITVEENSDAVDSVGSKYDTYTTSDDCDDDTVDVFRSAIVSDLEGRDVTRKEMSAAALNHLKKGGGFVQIPHGPSPSDEYDPDLFPMMYPTLFPYGCGGFEEQRPEKYLNMSLKLQARHYFSVADRRFQEHYSFLFTVFNILQRRAVCLGAKLKVGQARFGRFALDMRKLSMDSLSKVVTRLDETGKLSAENEDEQLVIKLMNEVNLTSKNVPASSASKVQMRNEIRGMMMDLGLPSFYITINPADVYNPVVRFLAGEEIDVDKLQPGENGNYNCQATLIAKNPFVSAKFLTFIYAPFLNIYWGIGPAIKMTPPVFWVK